MNYYGILRNRLTHNCFGPSSGKKYSFQKDIAVKMDKNDFEKIRLAGRAFIEYRKTDLDLEGFTQLPLPDKVKRTRSIKVLNPDEFNNEVITSHQIRENANLKKAELKIPEDFDEIKVQDDLKPKKKKTKISA